MAQETIKFIIRQDGMVTEEVMGGYRELDPTGEKENEYSVSETDPSSQ